MLKAIQMFLKCFFHDRLTITGILPPGHEEFFAKPVQCL